jgi:hypothetical protein
MAREFNIAKSSGCCLSCQKHLEPGDKYTATLRQSDEEFFREDFCLDCWGQQKDKVGPEVFGIWLSEVPQPKQKKKLLVDNDVLLNFFRRLEGTDDPQRIRFRYVLTLILMRKRILSYQGSGKQEQTEVWQMRHRGTEDTYEVVDPRLTEDEIADVSEQLNQILEQDL